jgi:hypothetical protein
MLKIAIEHFPEPRRETARYSLIAYGRSGKAVLTSRFSTLGDLLGVLRLAGVTLEEDEEGSLIRDDKSEDHSILVVSNGELHDSQIFLLGLMPPDDREI